MAETRIILGIDISTTCTGVSIISYDGEETKVLYIDRVKFKKDKKVSGIESLFIKSNFFRETFIEKYKNIGITDVVIEEPLPSSQNIGTVTTLLKFNGMLSQSIYESTGIIPTYISSYDARKFAFPDLMAVRKYNKKGDIYPKTKIRHALKNSELVLFGNYPWDCQKKHILWNKISELYPDIEWVYDKKGELKTENFDASDSLVCCLGYINKMKYGEDEPKIISSSEQVIKTENGTEILKFVYETEFCNQTFIKSIELDID
jgi:hypothetical protein